MALPKPVEGTLLQPESPPEGRPLPSMYDLPSENPEDPGLPDEFHYYQPQLLRETFFPPDYGRDQVFIGTDINLYYDLDHPLWYKRPDWFAVLGQTRLYEQRELRLSYVAWQERLSPYVVVELLSPGTEDEDLGRSLWDVEKPPTKWIVYERILKVPYYLVFSRYTRELQAFGRVSGTYRPLVLENGKLWLPEARLGLGIWEGVYEGVHGHWLRWMDERNEWLPSRSEERDRQKHRADRENERADREQQRADHERQRADHERQRAERLEAQLRALGIEPEE